MIGGRKVKNAIIMADIPNTIRYILVTPFITFISVFLESRYQIINPPNRYCVAKQELNAVKRSEKEGENPPPISL